MYVHYGTCFLIAAAAASLIYSLLWRPLHVIVRLIPFQPVNVPAEFLVPIVGILLHDHGGRRERVLLVTDLDGDLLELVQGLQVHHLVLVVI